MPKERPIIFKGNIVRAILEGRKTQTRRVMKPQPFRDGPFWAVVHRNPMRLPGGKVASELRTNDVAYLKATLSFLPCPYGVPGDRLWAKETWGVASVYDYIPPSALPTHIPVWFRANNDVWNRDGRITHSVRVEQGKWRPSIHMPKWAARIWLEIADVRVERLDEISSSDCEAEGITGCTKASPVRGQPYEEYTNGDGLVYMEPRAAFAALWDCLSAKGGYPWESNPWVWVVTFKVIEAAPRRREKERCFERNRK